MFSHKRLFTAAVVAWLGCLAQYCWAANVVTLVKFNPQTQLNEGLTIDKEGNIYVGFYNTGEIWKLTPSGKHGIFATLDVTSTNGGGLVGLALDDEGSLYVCDGSGNAATNGIWKVDKNGNARMLAATGSGRVSKWHRHRPGGKPVRDRLLFRRNLENNPVRRGPGLGAESAAVARVRLWRKRC